MKWNHIRMEKNQWIEELDYWCPAQIYYYFEDDEGGRWCIYLRWRWDDPWTAELVRCDDKWNFCWDSPDNIDLLKETEHTPGTVTGYFLDDEYRYLEEEVLQKVRIMFSQRNVV